MSPPSSLGTAPGLPQAHPRPWSCGRYMHEIFHTISVNIGHLLNLGRVDLLRGLVTEGMAWRALEDTSVREGVFESLSKTFGRWTDEDGEHYSFSVEVSMLLLRASRFLVMEKQATEESAEESAAVRSALKEWLPPPAELLRICEQEGLWRSWSSQAHPSLLCARLR